MLALIVPSAVSAQWRINASGSSEIDAMRFDLPEQAHEFLRDYRINELASTHNYVSEKLYPSETYSDGRLISWLCMHRSDAPGSYDPDTCYFGALSGTTLTKFIIPGEMTDSPLLNRDLGKPETELCVGNPINLATGNKYQQETDYVSADMEPLVFTRHYNSQLALSGKQSDVGIGWSHNYSNKVIFDKESHGENMVVLHRPDGKELAFYRTNAVWMPTWKSDDRLYKDSGWRYQRADGVVELYDSNGQLIRIVHPSGNELDLNYTNGKLDSVSDSFGRTLRFSYDQGKIIKMIDPAGQTFSYDYSNELLVAVHKPDANQRSYHYEDSLNQSLLTGLTDEKGSRFATWSYDPSGRAVLSEHNSGVDRTSVTYNPDGSVTVTNALGHEQHYLFSRYNGKLKPDSIQGAACTGFAGGTKSFGYDANGELKSIINEEGQSFSYQYDQRGLEISRTSSTGDTITTQWHSEFPKPTKITSSYLVQEFAYDDHHRLLTLKLIDRTNSDVRQWAFEYYPDSLGVPGQLKSVDGPRVDVDDVTRFEYDAQANLSRVINSLGHVVSFDNYDAHGRAQSVTDANGVSYSLNYNTLGQLISSTGPDGTTLYSYDESGLLVSITLPTNSTFTYEYDAAQQLMAVIDANGNRQSINRDLLGNIEQVELKDNSGIAHWKQLHSYTLNGWLSSTTNGTGNVYTYSYDKTANLTGKVDPSGNAYAYRYDGFSNLLQSIDPVNRATAMQYNDNALVTRVTDPRGRRTYYSYNGYGDVLSVQSPDTGTAHYTYDKAGNLSGKTDAKGQVFTYHYDALNRLSSITVDGQPNASVTFRYDEPEALYGVGQLTSITDASGVSKYSYTASGEIASQELIVDGRTLLTNYTYVGAGQLASIEYPSGRKAVYQRNVAGEVIGITLNNGVNSRTLVSDLVRKPFGPVTDLTHGNGLWEERQYDMNYQLESVQVAGAMHRSYLYTANSNVDSITDLMDSSYSQTFNYDKLSRLIDATGGYGTREYTYNYNGNRTAIYRDGVKDSYSIVFNSNRLTKTSIGSITYSYDANGNTIGRGTDVFVYDAFNRLTEATVNGETSTYHYNSAHQRVRKSAGGVDVLYVYGVDGELLAEVDAGTGQTQREYVWLDGQLVAYLVDGTVYHVHNDHLGTPQALTDETGATVWKASYSPFGKATVTTEQIKFNLRFPGQYYDAETGLHYNWHRYYDPSLGRYLQSDPLGLHAGVDTYGYVNGNPLSLSDPTGLCPWCVFGAVVGGGLNFATQLYSGHDVDWSSVVASTVTGALGGGLGTITKGLSWGSNIIVNTVGSAGIGAVVAATKNELTGSCDDVWESAKQSAFYGGLGAVTGNSIASLGKGLSAFQARQRWMNLTLEERLFAASNAIYRPNKPPMWATIGVTGGNVVGNVISNYPGDF
ncbi:RHS repeat-associated core domain-containing protein [Vibrio splendidus]|uniref:Type IV secretion protein Rhs n=3 Tax=Vibrio splendidus TaxID=29497 RepID=A0A2T5EJS0_VIBSP|nr:RHS repeat-associated core domain-containing protein [Vibrio splendidus]EHY9845526.1 RHS repeat protein [Vibrio cholerae]PTP20480.1 type IV secretion protein Rhs [Vibrio splendidus]